MVGREGAKEGGQCLSALYMYLLKSPVNRNIQNQKKNSDAEIEGQPAFIRLKSLQ